MRRKSNIPFTSLVRGRGSKHLPNELLHLIITFFTNDYRELIFFSTICRQWKEVSDRSIIWKTCDLKFQIPLNHQNHNDAESTLSVKKIQGFHLQELLLQETIRPRRDIYKVVIYDVRLSINELSKGFFTQPASFQEEYKAIHDRFMSIQAQYRQYWQSYAYWLTLRGYINHYLDHFFLVCIVVMSFFVGLTRYHFMSILKHSSSSSASSSSSSSTEVDYLGMIFFFIGLQGIFSVYMVLFLGGEIRDIVLQFTNSQKFQYFDEMRIDYRRIFEFTSFLSLFLGYSVSILLLQLKVMFGFDDLSYGMVLRPIWLLSSAGLILLMMKYSVREVVANVLSFLAIAACIFSIPLSLQTLATYYDSPVSETKLDSAPTYLVDSLETLISSIHYLRNAPIRITDAILPLTPIFFLLLFIWSFRTFTTVNLWRDYFAGSIISLDHPKKVPYISNSTAILFVNTISTMMYVLTAALISSNFSKAYQYSDSSQEIHPIDYWIPISNILVLLQLWLGLVLLELILWR